MRIQFHKSLMLALGAYCAPALLMAQSYLPLPETSAPVYRPVSANYYSSEPEGSALVSRMTTPPGEADEVPAPSDGTAVELPSESYDDAVVATTGKGGKCCSQKGCGKGGCSNGLLGMGYLDGGDCGIGGFLGNACCWYGGVYAINWDRDRERETQITVRSDNERDAILNNRSVEMDNTIGYQLTIGRYICCGQAALEATWWAIDPDTQSATVLDPAGVPSLQTSFDFSTLNYDPGTGAVALNTLVDGAQAHRVSRDYEFRNLELNVVHHTCCGTIGGGKCGGNQYQVSLVGGLRYLNFNDNFLFEADPTDANFDADVIRYNIDIENNLYGLQFGTRADYYVTHSFGLHAVGKMGVYLNDIDHNSFIGGANGPAIVGAGPNAGRAYNISAGKTDVAFLGELDLGVSYRWGCNWRARAGYRVIAMSQVAQAMDQIPVYFQDIDGVAATHSESSMYLHGGYAGVEFNF